MASKDNHTQRSINIGINYAGTKNALKGCVGDSVKMASLMLKLGIDDIVLLIDHDYNDLHNITLPSDLAIIQKNKNNVKVQLPTKNIIIREIQKAVRDTSITSLFISYAGHGMQGRPFITNTEESDLRDEYICCLGNSGRLEGTTRSFISDDELINCINLAGSKRDTKYPLVITYVFDCCHSGTIFDLPYSLITLDNGIEFKTEPKNMLKYDHIVINGWSGCQDNQLSREDRRTMMLSEGRCTKSFVRVIEMVLLDPDEPMTDDRRSMVTNFELHKLIMQFLYYIDRTKDDEVDTSAKYQVINYSSSRNIGLDRSGKKIVSEVFVPGAVLHSYGYDDIVRVLDRSNLTPLQIVDHDPVSLTV